MRFEIQNSEYGIWERNTDVGYGEGRMEVDRREDMEREDTVRRWRDRLRLSFLAETGEAGGS